MWRQQHQVQSSATDASKLATVEFTVDRDTTDEPVDPDASTSSTTTAAGPNVEVTLAAPSTCTSTTGADLITCALDDTSDPGGLRQGRPHGGVPVTRPSGGRLESSRPRPIGSDMNAATRAASISAIAALVLAAAWLFWPAQLGGATTYVSTHGISMEPGFSTGDLAVLRPADSYEVGDVVAYHAQSLDTVVMHRIVAVEGDRFVFQGDNNDWLDEDRPTDRRGARQAVPPGPPGRQGPGRRRLAVVAGADLRRRLRAVRHQPPDAPAAALRAAPAPGAARPPVRRRRRPCPTAFSMPTRAQARQVAIASGAVAILAAGAGAVLLAMPSTETEARTQPMAQEGRFTYSGDCRGRDDVPDRRHRHRRPDLHQARRRADRLLRAHRRRARPRHRRRQRAAGPLRRHRRRLERRPRRAALPVPCRTGGHRRRP